MAFNPFAAFQRNQKLWMALLVLLSMVTFVFCGGAGDLGEKLIRMTTGRGTPVMHVNGSTVTSEDLSKLRAQRAAANGFMRRIASDVLANLARAYKEESEKKLDETNKKAVQQRRQKLASLIDFQDQLMTRLSKPRYFEPGNRYEDLIEFKLWQAQADRLNVALQNKQVRDLVHAQFFGYDPDELLLNAIWHEQRNNQFATPQYVMAAVREEFRVQVARLATMASQPGDFLHRQSLDQPHHTDPSIPDWLARAPLTPATYWDFYRDKRSDFEVTLLPVDVRDFIKDVPTPTKDDLQRFFDAHREVRYDPASPVIGLEVPHRVKAGFVMADPTSPGYQGLARARLLLDATSPLAAAAPTTALGLVIRYGGGEAAYQTDLQRHYEALGRNPRYYSAPLGAPTAAVEIALAGHLAARHPRAAAALIGSMTAPALTGDASATAAALPLAGYLAWGPAKNPDEYATALAEETRRREAISYALLGYPAALGLAPTLDPHAALTLPAAINAVQRAATAHPLNGVEATVDLRLPLPVVRDDIERILARNQAEEWARANMEIVREELEKVTGKGAAFQRVLDKYVPLYHLTYGETKSFRDRYDIGKSKALAPLEQSFRKYVFPINTYEGRENTPERKLTDDDFYKMFFGNERFATSTTYKALPWPPAIMPAQMQLRKRMLAGASPGESERLWRDLKRYSESLDPTKQAGSFDLFAHAEKPALYWKEQDKQAEVPEKLTQVNDETVRGWKYERARTEKALPQAEEVARNLQKAAGDYANLLPELSRKARREPVRLPGLAPLTPAGESNPFTFGARDYGPYRLPRDAGFEYPRTDMIEHLLSLYDLSRPITITPKDAKGADAEVTRRIDALNKSLFDLTRKEKNPKGHYVQVLTNRPLSQFYVAVVTKAPQPNVFGYMMTLRTSGFGRPDPLMSRAQEAEGTRIHNLWLSQLKNDFNFEDVASEEERKRFQDNSGS